MSEEQDIYDDDFIDDDDVELDDDDLIDEESSHARYRNPKQRLEEYFEKRQLDNWLDDYV